MIFNLPDFMASSNARKGDSQRPRPIHVSKSFSRSEPSSPAATRNQRASTLQIGSTSVAMLDKSKDLRDRSVSEAKADVFEKTSEEDEKTADMTGKLPADFDELPIELVALTDRSVQACFLNNYLPLTLQQLY